MASWKEKAAHSVDLLINAATVVGTVAIVNATDIRTQANVVKTDSTDSSTVEASEIARKIRDGIKQNRPDITISGSI